MTATIGGALIIAYSAATLGRASVAEKVHFFKRKLGSVPRLAGNRLHMLLIWCNFI
jgi:hypothetical protein